MIWAFFGGWFFGVFFVDWFGGGCVVFGWWFVVVVVSVSMSTKKMPVAILTQRCSTVEVVCFCDVLFSWLYTLDRKISVGKWLVCGEFPPVSPHKTLKDSTLSSRMKKKGCFTFNKNHTKLRKEFLG